MASSTRNTTKWTRAVLVAYLCVGSGCTYAIPPSRYNGANNGGEVVALLALDLLFRTISAALSGGAAAVDPFVASARYWDDPDDWVAECSGPTRCAEHRHMMCEGYPGACDCRCVISEPRRENAAVEEPRPSVRRSPRQSLHRASRTGEVASRP